MYLVECKKCTNFFSSLRHGDQSTVFCIVFLILPFPGLQRSGTLLHWFVDVILPILKDLFLLTWFSKIQVYIKA